MVTSPPWLVPTEHKMDLKKIEVWRIRNADRWSYVGWSTGNTTSAPKNHPTRFHWVAKVENTAFALFLLRREPLQGFNGLSGDLLISHHGSLWTRGTFCEWPNHRDGTDFFMWSNLLPQHRHYQLVSSSRIFFCQWRCSVWPLVCQTEGKGLLRRKLGIVSWQCALAWALNPDTPHVSGLCSSPSKQGGAPPQQGMELSQLTSGYNSAKWKTRGWKLGCPTATEMKTYKDDNAKPVKICKSSDAN